MIPYYYQSEAKIAVEKALEQGITEQLLVMATGTGKTRTAVDICTSYKKILWIAHNIELIEQSAIALLHTDSCQPKSYFEDRFKEEGGIVNVMKGTSDFCKSIQAILGIIKEDNLIIDRRICVASIQTLWRRLDQIPPDSFDVVVIDEAHHSGAPSYMKTIQHFKPKLRLGLTATPWRQVDDTTLDDLFQKIVYEYPIEKAIKDGYLCKPDAIKVKTSANLDKVHTIGSDFNQKELGEKVNTPERNNLIVSKYLEYAKGRPFVAFCCNVEHTIDLHDTFAERGVKVRYVVGDKELCPNRQEIISAFKSQDIDNEAEGLINCMIATEGFDYIDAGCVILASPTKSKTKFYQTIGRGLRLKSSKFTSKFGQNCIILDVVDNTTKHAIVNCATEDNLRSLEDKIFMSDVDKQKIRDAVAARERMVTIVDRKEDERVELFRLPGIKAKDFGDASRNPASAGAILWLRANGFDTVNTTYTDHQFKSLLFASKASDEDVQFLKDNGYDVSGYVSFGQVQAIKFNLNKKQ